MMNDGVGCDDVFLLLSRRCGTCDGQCGPSNGCPCSACVELAGFKVTGGKAESSLPVLEFCATGNVPSAGHPVRKGQSTSTPQVGRYLMGSGGWAEL